MLAVIEFCLAPGLARGPDSKCPPLYFLRSGHRTAELGGQGLGVDGWGFLSPFLTSCVTFGHTFNFSVPQFFSL